MSAANFASPGAGSPADILEMRAAEQRRRVHNTVAELRETVREKMDVRKTARRYLWPASGVAAILGLALGYGFGGIFTR